MPTAALSPLQQDLFVAISGGHHCSTAIAFEPTTRQVWSVVGESLNHHVHLPKIITVRLERLTKDLSAKMGIAHGDLFKRSITVVFAMPGAAKKPEQTMVQSIAEGAGWLNSRCRYVDDTWAGLVAGTRGYRGICAVAGTGASVFVGEGDIHGRQNKIDGWGMLIGDFGSGFQLAVEMFRFFCRAKDRSSTPPELFRRLLKLNLDLMQGVRSFDDVQQWFDARYMVDPDWRVNFALLAMVPVIAADELPPDSDAVRLVTRAANDMVESIQLALSRASDRTRSLPVVLLGGMFEHSRLYRQIVIDRVQELTDGPVQLSKYRPVVGALAMALADGWPPASTTELLPASFSAAPTRTQSDLRVQDGSTALDTWRMRLSELEQSIDNLDDASKANLIFAKP